jgi:hypothetical protein
MSTHFSVQAYVDHRRKPTIGTKEAGQRLVSFYAELSSPSFSTIE